MRVLEAQAGDRGNLAGPNGYPGARCDSEEPFLTCYFFLARKIYRAWNGASAIPGQAEILRYHGISLTERSTLDCADISGLGVKVPPPVSTECDQSLMVEDGNRGESLHLQPG